MLKPLFLALSIGLLPLPSLAACVPKIIGNTVVVSQNTVAKVTYKGSIYRFVGITGQRPKEKFSAILREKDGACWVTFADPGGEALSLSEGAPRPVAIAFSKTYLVAYMSRFGKAKLLKKYANLQTMAPEDAEAFKQLGLPLPSGVPIAQWSKQQQETPVR
jgi:hypothetical protein